MNKLDNLKSEYFRWLCDLVQVNKEHSSYFILAKILFAKEFYWSVPNDDNRIADGLVLREKFLDELQIDKTIDLGSCNLLEVLIGLAYRYNDFLSDIDEPYEMSLWFWEMISNLGLKECTDEAYGKLYFTPFSIDKILNTFLDRKYKKNGEGGLFPLKHIKKDQRKIDLWYQMNNYVMENHYINGNII